MPLVSLVFRVKSNFLMLKQEEICFKMILIVEIEPKKNCEKAGFFYTNILRSKSHEPQILVEKKRKDYKRKIF